MQDDWILSGQATSSSSRCWFLAALLSAPVSETLQVKPRTHFSGVSSGCLGFTTSSKFPTTDLSSSFLGGIIWKRSSTSKSYSPAPVLETLKSTTLYISTTDAISQKFQTTGAWALPPRKTWWIGHTLGMLVNGENIWHTVVLQPQFITAFFIPALQSSLLFLPFLTLHIACLFSLKKKPWIWVKCTEAPVRRATALSKCWFPLIHLFVVVYACLLQSHDCVSIATRVWVIICVTTFIPLRKGEGEVRLSSLSKEGAKGRRKDRQKGSGREAQARKIGKKQRLCRDMFCLVLAFCVLSFTLHASLYQ